MTQVKDSIKKYSIMKLKTIVSLGELPIKMKRSYETKLKVN